ncbi:MAG TPA: hypothetical protein VKU39_02345 [Streptosporangiaceae bacterium]|nr:hypothetical protein [Streptosporangiaceae bacterium]
MTSNRQSKRAAHALAAETGGSYTASRRALSPQRQARPTGIAIAADEGRCVICGWAFDRAHEIAVCQEKWGHIRCVGTVRDDIRSWLEQEALTKSIKVRLARIIASSCEAAGHADHARAYRAEAEAAIREYAAPPADVTTWVWGDGDAYRWVISQAARLLRDTACGTVPEPGLADLAGYCLLQLDLTDAADDIREMTIDPAPEDPAPDGPGTSVAARARAALDRLAAASRVGYGSDEELSYCEDLIRCAGKIALWRMPDGHRKCLHCDHLNICTPPGGEDLFHRSQ